MGIFSLRPAKRTPAAPELHIRWMIRSDMPKVLAIESEAFEFPWSEQEFIWCLRRRNCLGMVAHDGARVLGFVVYEFTKTAIRIRNFAVAPDCRRRGIGLAMVAKLAAKLAPPRRCRDGIVLDVRETNLDAQLFFRSCGFRATGIVHDSYDDTGEDAYTMVLRHQPNERNQTCWC